MSRVVTQPSPCEHSKRSVAPMSFSLWSIAGERELTRAAAGLAMRDRAGLLEFELSERSRIMSDCSTRCQAGRGQFGPRPISEAGGPGCTVAWVPGPAAGRLERVGPPGQGS